MNERQRRDLDAEVAQKVMGFHRHRVPADYDGLNSGEVLVPPGFQETPQTWAPRGSYSFTHFVPKYSTELSAAWRVVEALENGGLLIQLTRVEMYNDDGVQRWFEVSFYGRAQAYGKSGEGADAPLAICQAALQVAEYAG